MEPQLESELLKNVVATFHVFVAVLFSVFVDGFCLRKNMVPFDDSKEAKICSCH